LKFWNLATGLCLRTIDARTEGFAYSSNRVSEHTFVALRADARAALAGFEWENVLKFWDLTTGRQLQRLKGHHKDITSVAISADGLFGLSGSLDTTIKYWDLAEGRCLHTLKGHTNRVSSLAITADGRFALSGSWDQTLKYWDLTNGSCLRTLEGHRKVVTSVAMSEDGCLGLSCSADGSIKLWWTIWDIVFPAPADWDSNS
jgi:WD40 repeat protein